MANFCTRGVCVLGRLQLDPEPRVVEAGGESLPPLVDQSHVRARQCVLCLRQLLEGRGRGGYKGEGVGCWGRGEG